ncbi:TlpA family protein disulfide reductase [Micromonospora auratinigra]|uniref:Thiol-disulfide isomerase or thioredoxin n=1 Tax=Micromonospora auratinigra TaxID=261654 RepID=A0A1A8YZE0_9ACTN|nr:redoxin domain-containing protein [Micromonospora auratinigra]SBT36898.1 Thiol-disulfide isomerase or thioredoxin [Micromonospora auratinigra]
MPAIRSTLPPLTLAAVLALTGCGGTGPTDRAAPATGGTPAASATPGTAGPTGVPGGSTAPTGSASPGATVPATLDFTARTLDGGSFAGASLAGRPAVLWFWAAWCTRCRGVAADVAALRRANADRISVVGVAGLGSGPDAMRRFATDTGIAAFPNLADDQGAVWRRFGVTSQEWYVLLDSTGKVVHSGALSQAELRRRVGELA